MRENVFGSVTFVYNHKTMGQLRLHLLRRAMPIAALCALAPFGAALLSADPRLKGAFRQPARDGWTMVHLEGRPGEIGCQHGRLLDHYDTLEKKTLPSEHTLCGHNELSPRGIPDWKGPWEPAGTVQNKVTDAEMAAKMTFWAASGHACGLSFKAKPHIAKHSEFDWQLPLPGDLNARGWARIQAPVSSSAGAGKK